VLIAAGAMIAYILKVPPPLVLVVAGVLGIIVLR
jgi:hypothetical protein